MFQIVRSMENHKKDWKIFNQTWEKSIQKRNNPPVFLNPNFFVFLKRNSFLFFKKKTTQKPHSELFLLHHAISPFSKLHKNELLYLLWHSNMRVKNVPHLCFRKVLLVTSLQSGKAWQERAQQTEKSHSHTTSAVSRQVYAANMPC